jgi:hypothetical protein
MERSGMILPSKQLIIGEKVDGPFKCMETRINPYMLFSEPVFVNLLKEPRN